MNLNKLFFEVLQCRKSLLELLGIDQIDQEHKNNNFQIVMVILFRMVHLEL